MKIHITLYVTEMRISDPAWSTETFDDPVYSMELSFIKDDLHLFHLPILQMSGKEFDEYFLNLSAEFGKPAFDFTEKDEDSRQREITWIMRDTELFIDTKKK